MARLLPSGIRKIDVVQNGHPVVGKVQSAEFDLSPNLCGAGALARSRAVSGLSSISGCSTRISLIRPMDAVPR